MLHFLLGTQGADRLLNNNWCRRQTVDVRHARLEAAPNDVARDGGVTVNDVERCGAGHDRAGEQRAVEELTATAKDVGDAFVGSFSTSAPRQILLCLDCDFAMSRTGVFPL